MASSRKNIEIPDLLRNLPSVDDLMEDLRAKGQNGASTPLLADAARSAIETRRNRIQAGEGISPEAGEISPDNPSGIREALRLEILAEARDILSASQKPALRHVINATGIVLHTNLGRAPLSQAACDALTGVSRSYSNLEYDIERGPPGQARQRH